MLFITSYAENAAVENGYLDCGTAVIFPVEVVAVRVREMIAQA